MLLKLKKVFVLLVLSMALPVAVMAQNITVTGTVTDLNGDSVIGAAVQVQSTTNGTVTDVDGKYSISVPRNAVLEVSSMGYKTQTVSVNGRTVIDVTLAEDAEAIEETVVIGYGTAKKSDVTGSIASINQEVLRQIPAGDISTALAGRVPGMEMRATSSKPGATMRIRIRGTRSLSASNDPLIVLDGIPYSGSLSDINVDDVKSIDVAVGSVDNLGVKLASVDKVVGGEGAVAVEVAEDSRFISPMDLRAAVQEPISVPIFGLSFGFAINIGKRRTAVERFFADGRYA